VLSVLFCEELRYFRLLFATQERQLGLLLWFFWLLARWHCLTLVLIRWALAVLDAVQSHCTVAFWVW